MQKKTINSRAKGASNERALSKWLSEYFGVEARRACQYHGLSDRGDVELHPSIHIECKAVESLNIHKALEQSIRDAGNNDRNPVPTVFHKKNRTCWLLTIRAEDIIPFCKVVNQILDVKHKTT